VVKAVTLDMTDVKDGGGAFNKKHRTPGDYKGKCTKVEDAKKKDDPSKKMWLFTIEVDTGAYPFYCTFDEKSLWKIKQLFVACGLPVPKKKVKLDPNKVVGRYLGVTLDDDEYNDKLRSQVASVFPVSELEGDDDPDDVDDDEDEDDEEEEAPKKSKKSKAPAAKPAKGKHGKKGKKVKDKDLDELDVEDL
jgi:hypothetical protein